MPGVLPLRRFQLGQEVTPGSAVAATTRWNGIAPMWKDARKITFPPQQVGLLTPTTTSLTEMVLGELELPEQAASFEQLPYLFDMGIKTVSGVQDGAGTGYVYTYAYPTTAANTIKTYTLETGDDTQESEAAYCFAKKIKISGSGGKEAGPVMVSADIVGRQVSASTYTGSLSIPTVAYIPFAKAKLYIDAIGGTMGSTQKTGTFLGFEWELETGWDYYFTGDGNLYFTGHKNTGIKGTCKITFEHDSTANTELDTNWRGEVARQIRISLLGAALGTPATEATKAVRLSMVGKWIEFDKVDEDNGNDILEGTFQFGYDATPASFGSVVVVNENSTLT